MLLKVLEVLYIIYWEAEVMYDEVELIGVDCVECRAKVLT